MSTANNRWLTSAGTRERVSTATLHTAPRPQNTRQSRTSRVQGVVPGSDREGALQKNRRGQPLTSHEVIVNLIAGTTTRTDLRVTAELDETIHPTGINITDREMRDLGNQHLTRNDVHTEWNYHMSPAT